MLELRPSCEHCNRRLPPDATKVRIRMLRVRVYTGAHFAGHKVAPRRRGAISSAAISAIIQSRNSLIIGSSARASGQASE